MHRNTYNKILIFLGGEASILLDIFNGKALDLHAADGIEFFLLQSFLGFLCFRLGYLSRFNLLHWIALQKKQELPFIYFVGLNSLIRRMFVLSAGVQSVAVSQQPFETLEMKAPATMKGMHFVIEPMAAYWVRLCSQDTGEPGGSIPHPTL